MIMKFKLSILVCLFVIAANLNAQERTFKVYTNVDQARTVAQKEDKNILVDVYASWCRVCKQMDAEVFSNPEVKEFIAKRFVFVKLDAERGGARFASKNDVLGFPTLLFLSSKGEEMHRIEGFANKDRLMRSADISFRNPNKQGKILKKQWKQNKNNPVFLEDYLAYAQESENWNLADKLTKQYVKNHKKVDSLVWMDFVLRNVYTEDSKVFDLLERNKSRFDAVYGDTLISKVFIEVILNTELGKMNQPEVEKLKSKAQKKLVKYKVRANDEDFYPALAIRAFNYEVPFKNTPARTELAVVMLDRHKELIDPKQRTMMIANLVVQRDDEKAITIADKEIDSLLAKGSTCTLHDLKSITLYKLGHKEDSYKQVALAQKYANAEKIEYKSSLHIMKKNGLIE